MLGDSDGVYNTLGVAISGNFEGYRAEGSVVVCGRYLCKTQWVCGQEMVMERKGNWC